MNYASYGDLLKLLPRLAAKIPVSSGSGLTNWQANTSYSIGDIIVHDGIIYEVTTAFTSGATFDDTNLAEYVPKELTQAQVQALINNFNPSGGGGGLV